MTRHLATLKES